MVLVVVVVVVWPPVSLLSIAFSFSSADDAVPFVFVAVDVVIDGISRIKNRNMAIHCTDVNDKSHFSRHLAKTWGEIVKVGVGVDIGGVLLVGIAFVLVVDGRTTLTGSSTRGIDDDNGEDEEEGEKELAWSCCCSSF